MSNRGKKNTSYGNESIVLTEKELNDRAKEEIRKIITKDNKVRGKNESQKQLIRSIKKNEITICSGLAGSGKTFVSLGVVLDLLRSTSNKFQKLYLIKSVTTLKGEEIGYLKGDLNEKFEPFMWSYLLNAEKFIDGSSIKNLIASGIIRPFPLAYARGITIDNSIILSDETQNISIDNARTLLTRIGSNSKMIILGDTNQIDLKNKEESSLKPLMEMFSNIEKIGVVEMSNDDLNVRNPLINVIENKFQMFMKNNNNYGK